MSQDLLCLGLDFLARTSMSCGSSWSESYELRVKSQKVSLSQVNNHDSAERSVTQIWWWGSKRNKVRQPADVDADVDSCTKTKMKDPNSEEGDAEEY